MDASTNPFYQSATATASPPRVDKPASINISIVKSFVDTNLPRIHDPRQVAEQLNCALNRLKRTFYESERMTLSQFIRESRLSKMKEQLVQSDLACKVICLALGVREDAGARMFKNATGVTMEGFRKMQKDLRC
jgi:AraC-like DNA-binding protein